MKAQTRDEVVELMRQAIAIEHESVLADDMPDLDEMRQEWGDDYDRLAGSSLAWGEVYARLALLAGDYDHTVQECARMVLEEFPNEPVEILAKATVLTHERLHVPLHQAWQAVVDRIKRALYEESGASRETVDARLAVHLRRWSV